jgi:porin
LLVNNGFGISSSLGQTGVNGPSVFPTTALALYVKYHSPTRFYFESGFFNATAGSANSDYGTRVTVDSKNGYLGICETGYAEDGGDRPFKYAVGIWNYTQPEESIDPSAPKQHNWGGYLLADHHWSKHFGGFLRYGIASPQMNEFSSVYEVGAEWREPVNGRTKDGIALGVVTGVASGAYRATTGSLAYERAIEATYSYH